MNIKEVKDIINDILQSDISEFELEHTGTKVRLRRGVQPQEPIQSRPPSQTTIPTSAPALAIQEESTIGTEEAAEENLHYIISPIVGTFCRASSPGAEPYVNIGDVVEEGTILCIIEAMKLMNEIPSDIAGEIVRILVENGQPVEFGQKLFAVRPRK